MIRLQLADGLEVVIAERSHRRQIIAILRLGEDDIYFDAAAGLWMEVGSSFTSPVNPMAMLGAVLAAAGLDLQLANIVDDVIQYRVDVHQLQQLQL